MKINKHNKKIVLSLLVIIAAVVSFTGILNMVNAQNSNTIISYSVTGSPNWNAPGTESFWNNIPWTAVSLIQSENGGGHTSEISVKSAHTSNEIYVLVTWNDSHPSYVGSSAFGFNSVAVLEGKGTHGTYYINGPNRTQEAMAVENGTLIGLYHNSTFYYPDRAAMMWSLGATSDCMNVGVNGGSLSTGAANIWEWEFGSTDNSSKDPAWNMWKNTTATGTSAVPTHSFALNLYANQSNLYQVGIGGNTTANWYNPVPGTVNVDPFNIWTAATYSNGNWTVEFVRNFTTPSQISNYEVQITPGKTYNVAFAVWQGYQGESAFVKSISPSFFSLTVSSAAPPSTSSTSTSASSSGISSTTLLLAGVIVVVIIVGTVVVVYIYKNPKDKK
jgi:hypothetical protein